MKTDDANTSESLGDFLLDVAIAVTLGLLALVLAAYHYEIAAFLVAIILVLFLHRCHKKTEADSAARRDAKKKSRPNRGIDFSK